MARVTHDTIADGDHAGKCQMCGGQSHAAWDAGTIELCCDCTCRVLPALLIDALQDCRRETIYQYREIVQTAYWRAAFSRLERETREQEATPV
jgi:hypothetical protein